MERNRTVQRGSDKKRLMRVWNVSKQDEGEGRGIGLARNFVEDEGIDKFEPFYSEQQLLAPPYKFDRLMKIYEESDVAQECVEAMTQNVDGFGYQLIFMGDDVEGRETPQAKEEFTRAQNFFDYANENQSWTTIRKLFRYDLESIGNGSFEVVRNRLGEIACVYQIPFYGLRISRLAKKPVTINATVVRNGKTTEIRVQKYFRKFAQISSLTGGNLRWFKTFGDPRFLDATDGLFKKTPQDCKILATEIIHQKIGFGVYGIPKWMGVVVDVVGRRSSQYVNYDLFESQGIPPMAIMVSGGVLTDESLDDINKLVDSMRGVAQWNKILILETQVESAGLEDKGGTKIDLKNLSEYRKDDLMFADYQKATERTIRHRWRLPPLYVGSAETFCVSEDTETLTENGWKFYHEVGAGEKIATINPENDELEYQVPAGPFVFDVDGEMHHFHNKAVDMLVTPNHRMYLSLRRGYPWSKMEAQEIFDGKSTNYRVCFKTAPSNYQVPDEEYFTLRLWHRREEELREVEESRQIPFEDFLTFVGMYIADGSLSPEGEQRYHIAFGVLKERKATLLRDLLNRFGEHRAIRVSECMDYRGYAGFTVSDRMLWLWVSENCGGFTKEKQIPDDFLKLNRQQSEVLLSALIAGDGNITRGKHCWPDLPKACRYATTSPKLAEQVQLLAFKCGYRASLVEGFDARPNRSDVYYVNMKRKSDVQIHNFQHEVVPYTGRVYCFEVPNHLFVTRRNGKIGIHGNTHATSKAAKEVAEEQIFIPERSAFDEFINNQIVIPELKILFWKYKTNGPKMVGAEEIALGVKTFADSGAFSVNNAIQMANEAFGLQMSKLKYPWANYPFPIVIKMAEQGMLKDVEEIAEAIKPIEAALPKPKPKEQLLLPEKIEKSDFFTEEEKVLYKRLLTIQHAVESMTCQ